MKGGLFVFLLLLQHQLLLRGPLSDVLFAEGGGHEGGEEAGGAGEDGTPRLERNWALAWS